MQPNRATKKNAIQSPRRLFVPRDMACCLVMNSCFVTVCVMAKRPYGNVVKASECLFAFATGLSLVADAPPTCQGSTFSEIPSLVNSPARKQTPMIKSHSLHRLDPTQELRAFTKVLPGSSVQLLQERLLSPGKCSREMLPHRPKSVRRHCLASLWKAGVNTPNCR